LSVGNDESPVFVGGEESDAVAAAVVSGLDDEARDAGV
jgi:hypothetical protein